MLDETAVRMRILRIGLDGLAVAPNGFVQIALLPERIAEVQFLYGKPKRTSR